MNRKCKNSPDSYCYICGSFTLKRCRRHLSPHVMELYELYFGCKVGDQDKRWAPHVCLFWLLKFAVSMVQRHWFWTNIWCSNDMERAPRSFN